jgi:hypothetical protein
MPGLTNIRGLKKTDTKKARKAAVTKAEKNLATAKRNYKAASSGGPSRDREANGARATVSSRKKKLSGIKRRQGKK